MRRFYWLGAWALDNVAYSFGAAYASGRRAIFSEAIRGGEFLSCGGGYNYDPFPYASKLETPPSSGSAQVWRTGSPASGELTEGW